MKGAVAEFNHFLDNVFHNFSEQALFSSKLDESGYRASKLVELQQALLVFPDNLQRWSAKSTGVSS